MERREFMIAAASTPLALPAVEAGLFPVKKPVEIVKPIIEQIGHLLVINRLWSYCHGSANKLFYAWWSPGVVTELQQAVRQISQMPRAPILGVLRPFYLGLGTNIDVSAELLHYEGHTGICLQLRSSTDFVDPKAVNVKIDINATWQRPSWQKFVRRMLKTRTFDEAVSTARECEHAD